MSSRAGRAGPYINGQSGETMLHFATQPDVQVLQGSATANWDDSTGDLRVDYTQNGLNEVLVTGGGTGPLLLIFGDDASAESFSRLDAAAVGDSHLG